MAFGMIYYIDCPMAYILCYGYKNNPKILFTCKPTKFAFINEIDEKLVAIAIEAWDLVATKPILEAYDFSVFLRA